MLVHVFFLMVLFWSHTAEYCRLTVGVSISVCKSSFGRSWLLKNVND